MAGSGVVPWKQFADPARRVFGDAGQDVGEPGVFFDAVESAGHEQAVHHRRPLAAAIRRDAMMPEVWDVRLRSLIHFIRSWGRQRWSSAINSMTALAI